MVYFIFIFLIIFILGSNIELKLFFSACRPKQKKNTCTASEPLRDGNKQWRLSESCKFALWLLFHEKNSFPFISYFFMLFLSFFRGKLRKKLEARWRQQRNRKDLKKVISDIEIITLFIEALLWFKITPLVNSNGL